VRHQSLTCGPRLNNFSSRFCYISFKSKSGPIPRQRAAEALTEAAKERIAWALNASRMVLCIKLELELF
jgi:hypothetical protein